MKRLDWKWREMSDGGFVKRGRGSVHLIPLWCWDHFFLSFFLILFFRFFHFSFFFKIFCYCCRFFFIIIVVGVLTCLYYRRFFFLHDFLFFVFVMHEKIRHVCRYLYIYMNSWCVQCIIHFSLRIAISFFVSLTRLPFSYATFLHFVCRQSYWKNDIL